MRNSATIVFMARASQTSREVVETKGVEPAVDRKKLPSTVRGVRRYSSDEMEKQYEI